VACAGDGCNGRGVRVIEPVLYVLGGPGALSDRDVWDVRLWERLGHVHTLERSGGVLCVVRVSGI
jgi:hypothetical protein